jgi:hypothetical protein
MAFGQSTPGTINVRINTPAGPKQFDITDFGPYPLYSSANIATTQATEIVYFNYSVGGPRSGVSGATATKLDTNMRSANGQLDASGEMLVYSMRIEFPPAIALADAQNLYTNVYSRLEIATEKPISEGPLSFYPQGGGLNFFGTGTSLNQVTNGQPTASAGRVFASPHYIGPITNFRVTEEFVATLSLTATTLLRIVLDGLRRRASQ